MNEYRIFFYYLLSILGGYLFLDKGFAYLGVGPIYVSEIGLLIAVVCGAIAFRTGRLLWSRFRQVGVVLLLIFMGWQAARTIPYLGAYRLDAARDAVLWGYAAYSLFLCFLIPKEWVDRFLSAYGFVMPVFLGWLPVAFVLVAIVNFSPVVFNMPITILSIKSGDVGVHLAGIAAFMLLGLNSRFRKMPRPVTFVLWLLWWIAWIGFGTVSRAGMLSALLGLGVVFALKPRADWLPALMTGVIVVGFLWVSDVHVPIRLRSKEVDVSYAQLVDNISSVTQLFRSQSRAAGIQNLAEAADDPDVFRGTTIRWRLDWWKKIIGYTIDGQYFWQGKGYGINLADSDGFQVKKDHSLRSPHNAFMTILARSGVPGLVLWLMFLFGFIGQLVYARFRKNEDPYSALVAVWLLAYLAAFLFNASFDVFLEGPMGGVWFWSLVGFGLIYFHHSVLEESAKAPNLPAPLD